MYERFTDRARKVMQLANSEAERFNHEYIGTEHVLLGLVKEASGVASNVLRNLDVDLRKIRLEVEKIVQTGPADQVITGKRPQTPRVKKVIEYAVDEARGLNHNYVGTEHLLLGLLREQEGVAAQVLLNLGLKLDDVREEVLNLLDHNLPDSQAGTSADRIPRRLLEEAAVRPPASQSKTPTLDLIGRDLTDLTRRGKFDPLVGREGELRALIEVLTCRSRRNPLLLGQPGVGRSMLVAGLAHAIGDGRVPEWLRHGRVVFLPVSQLWADGHGGRLVSEQARAVFNEVRRAKDTVLFLPDAVASLGNPLGGPTAERIHAQLLTALWTEQVPCILSATPAEYESCLRRRPALAGSVQPIILRPATVEETVTVLRGVRDRYEAHHRVSITDEALTAAAEAAGGLPGVLPGKAVVLMDRAAARARIRAAALPPDIAAAVRDFDEQIERVNNEKEAAVAAHDFERAAALREQADALKQEKARLLQEAQDRTAPEATVDAVLIAEVARDLTGDAPPAAA